VIYLPIFVKTLRFSLLQNFIASSDRGNAWYFQAWNTRAYEKVRHAKNVLKLKFDPTCFQEMPPFYADALEGRHSMNTIVNLKIQSVADLRDSPIWNSRLLTPHISGHTLVSEGAWTTLNVFCVGDLLKENCHWKDTEDFNTDRGTIPTFRRLAANLKTAEAFFRHHHPNLPLQIRSLPLVLSSNNQTANRLHSPYPEKRPTENYFCLPQTNT
jgi:hypothetical protein